MKGMQGLSVLRSLQPGHWCQMIISNQEWMCVCHYNSFKNKKRNYKLPNKNKQTKKNKKKKHQKPPPSTGTAKSVAKSSDHS